MEAHGGYLCRYEDVDVGWLQQVARLALADDGQDWNDVGLQVTVLNGPGVVRFSWDGPFSYGRSGARWYLTHHALARKLSEHLGLTLHSYVFDPDELEQVVAWGNGRRVGGDELRYETVDLDEDDELAFERAKKSWPLSHLARVLGVPREELIRIPRRPMVLIDLSAPFAPQPLWQLFPDRVRAQRPVELYAVR